jgi:hypothetical protein
MPTETTAPPAANESYDVNAAYHADMQVLEDVTEPIKEDKEEEKPNVKEDEVEDKIEEGDEDKVEDKEEVAEPKDEAKITEIRAGHPRPTVKDITAKYPNFFKDFPDIRHAIFREKEYTAIYPTVDDAKEAQSNSTDFSNFRDMLQTGTPEKFDEFLSGVKQGGPQMLGNMAVNFLPSLYKADRDMYFKVTTPVADSLLKNAYKAAKQSGNENLANAALHIAQWALGDARYASGELKTDQPKVESAAADSFSKERDAFYMERYNETQRSVGSEARTKIKAEIKKGLDPNGVFNDFMTDTLVDKIWAEIGQELEKDPQHMGAMNSLWKHAKNAGFAGDWKNRILSAYLSGARAQMPAIRARIRAAALADKKVQVAAVAATAEKSLERKDVPSSGNAPNRQVGSKTPPAAEIDWGKTSDMDILNDKPTLRKRN